MDNQSTNNRSSQESSIMGNLHKRSELAGALSLLALVLVVWVGVDIWNNVKEHKYIGKDAPIQNTISVQGVGEVYAKPDLAMTSFGVRTEASAVESAVRQNTERMNAVVAAIKAQGIAEKDLKTTSYNIYPKYEYQQDRVVSFPIPPSGRQVLVGYEVSQWIEVKMRDLAKIGDVIQAATRAGANESGGLSFTVDNEDAFRDEARAKAIAQAKKQADVIASQLGVKLVRILNFNEGFSYPRYYGLDAGAAFAKGGAEIAVEPAPDVQTGENKIEVSVSITYEIN